VAATAAAKIPDTRVENFFGAKPKYLLHEPGDLPGLRMGFGSSDRGPAADGKSDDGRFRSFTYSLAQAARLERGCASGGGAVLALQYQLP
jgi:hypothetical protein